MRPAWPHFAVAIISASALIVGAASGEDIALRVSPSSVLLASPEATQQLLVTSVENGQSVDVTRSVRYESAETKIANVTNDGRVLPRHEGATEIVIRHAAAAARIPVVVRGLAEPEPVSFRHEVLPILSKAGCNSGGCHGKAAGQNGFKLSIFGFDPDSDHVALVKEARGRRISIAAPTQSLLLRKATAELTHGGGIKIEQDSLWYRRVSRWMAEGAQLDDESAPRVTAIEVEPSQVVMSTETSQQLCVTAIDSSGARRCVTVEAEYRSNADAIADADHDGLVIVNDVPGEAAILVRYLDQVGVCRVTIPQPGAMFTRPPENNFIDEAVWDKLQRLGLRPSELADDATFLRRVYLDTIGTLPTVAESREFLSNDLPDKRGRLIDRLLERDEYADYWAMRWADILRVDKSIVTPQGAVAMTRWLKRQFKKNTSYDEFARQIVTARGNTLAESPAAFFQVHKDPQMLGRSVSQVFLGVRIECARCHHHPFEHWSQQGLFRLRRILHQRIGRNGAPTGGQKIVPQAGDDLKHPRTQENVSPAALGADPPELNGLADRRVPLADWMTSPHNPFFARMISNRLWAHYFGRGLVEPIDDMRATNPATNEPLLDALAGHLVDVKFDLRDFTRSLLNSRVYQLRSQPNESNQADQQNFSHAAWKPLPAEVLLDAICQATAVAEQFNGWPEGYRAIQIWDNRMPSYFFRVFGRPQRVSVCECERGNEPSIAQALHLMNSPETVRKIRHRDGQVKRLADSNFTADEIIEELYLATLSRFPSDKEQAWMKQSFDESGDDRVAAVEDVMWTLLNTREFVYNH